MTFVITVDDVAQRLNLDDLGPADARAVRALKLGYSLAGLLDLLRDKSQMDLDAPCILWWLARRKAGETIDYETAEGEFPTYTDVGDRLKIEVETPDDEAGSPEA